MHWQPADPPGSELSHNCAIASMSDVAAPDGNPATHFEIVTRNGKNKLYKCKYCDKEFSGTGTRCYVHLTGDGTGVARSSSVPQVEPMGVWLIE